MIVTVRQASLSDLEVIHAIRREAILGIKSDTLAATDRRKWADKRSQEFFVDRVAAGDTLIAMCEGNAVGWGSASGGFVTGLYVRPSVGLRGVGRKIMSSLESRILKDGQACARLDSSPNAVQFYSRLGYVALGPPEDDGAIPMKKVLGSDTQPRAA